MDKEKLFSRIKKTESDCWEFTGAKRSGYGAVKIDGRVWGAHRLSYQLTSGNIPDGLFVCHHCDNRKCINPLHLFLGSRSDNMIDAGKKGRLNSQSRTISHPSLTAYERGCRCNECRKIKSDYRQSRKIYSQQKLMVG